MIKQKNIYESDYLENAWEIKINIGTNTLVILKM
jgi:hypothetical protein